MKMRHSRGKLFDSLWTYQESLSEPGTTFKLHFDPLDHAQEGTIFPIWGLTNGLSSSKMKSKVQLQGFQNMSKKKKPVKYLTIDEFNRFSKAVRDGGDIRDRLLYNFMYQYGLRVTEALQMKVKEDVNLKTGRVWVNRIKGGISREYRIEGDTLRLLRRYLRARETYRNSRGNPYLFMSPRSGYTPMTTYAVNKRFKEYCRTADIPEDKAHSHVLRHSVSVHILLNGSGDIHYVSDHLGHTDLKSTAHYAKLAPPEWGKRQERVGSRLRKI